MMNWNIICKEVQTQTANTNLKLLLHDRLMRTDIKCNEAQGTLIHDIWEYEKNKQEILEGGD